MCLTYQSIFIREVTPITLQGKNKTEFYFAILAAFYMHTYVKHYSGEYFNYFLPSAVQFDE